MRTCKLNLLLTAFFVVVSAGLSYAAVTPKQFEAGKKAKVSGMIQSRNGDLVNVKIEKSEEIAVVDLTDNTKIQRKKGALGFRRSDYDVTAMVPGLTIDAEGVGNAKGQLEASKIVFSPDDFNIAVMQYQASQSNKAAAAEAQSTANQGVAAAGQAQSSADQAQSSANQAGDTAQAAGTLAVLNTVAVHNLNSRVSDLDDYKTVVEAAIFFETNSSTLVADDKKALDKLADDAKALDNYMIEIAGYASSTGTNQENQKLSDARATAVANYLRQAKSVPMRRILEPAGYGQSHPVGANDDPQGRAINRRVDVKVVVNKGLEKGI
jgi:outer membrane protein OmpA-like peptidoglycan-associated protein